MSNVNLLLGRIIIGIYFLVFGAIFKLFNYEFTLNYMFDHQVPYTEISLIITIVLQSICSVSILVGYYSKLSAFVLALLTILINYYMHDFWNMSEGREPVNFQPNDRLSTTAGPWLYEATHSLVFYEKNYMLKEWELFPNTKDNPHPLIIDWSEQELLDVDTETDFKIVRYFHEQS